jgi:neurotransmitter:Na+ symporter, NSS family
MNRGDNNQNWSSGFVFVLAAIGAAVGLGNIWKFPYVAGVSGGGAFVLVYVACVAFVALPILIGELLIGRLGHHSPPLAVSTVARQAGRSPRWSVIGWMGMVTAFLVGTFYCVIAGWTLLYVVKAGSGFADTRHADVAQQFDAFLANPPAMIFWQAVFMLATVLIVGKGLHDGIERTVKFMMPALFAMLLIMIGYAAVEGDFRAGFEFLFHVDFSKISGEVLITAAGQAFFSVGVATGLMLAYGAYVPRHVSLTRSALIIAGADTIVALLAGLMIFPMVFRLGMNPGEGPGLIFVTLPTVFVEMPGGSVFGALFFLLLAFAAITSMIATLVPIVAYAADRWSMPRWRASVLFGFLCWIIGLVTVFSFNVWSAVYPLDFLGPFAGKTPFDLVDYLVSNILMPVGGVLIAVFVGWRMSPALLAEELHFGSRLLFQAWLVIMRFVAPLAILVILVSGLRR